jgi:hypothetical protein
MSPLLKALIAAGIALAAGASRSETITLQYNVGTDSHWGNVATTLGPSFSGTLSFDFWWTSTPAVGSVFVAANVRAPTDTAVSFANMTLWQCGPLDCNTVAAIPLPGVNISHTPFNGNPNDIITKFYIDRVNVDVGHYLFSFDVTNNTSDPLALTAMAGVFPGTGPAVSPVPEPGTWALMLTGLGVVAWAARRRGRAAAEGEPAPAAA